MSPRALLVLALARRRRGATMAPRALLVLALALGGCAASTATGDGLDPLFAGEGAAGARARAPDLYAAAEQARRDAAEAERERDVVAAADHATRARLLLTAATVEADRLALEDERLALERAAHRDTQQALRDEAARADLDLRMTRERAAELALEQAELAFRQAEQDEPRRRSRDDSEVRAMHRRAAGVILRRASLALSAAEAMGAEPGEVASLRARIDAARAEGEPAAALGEADRVHADVQRLLGVLRARSESPAPEVARSLMTEAHLAGFEVRAEPRGVVLTDGALFRGASVQPDRRRLERLHTLLEAFPHGAVRLEVYGPAAEARRLDARARTLAASLVRAGQPHERLSVEAVGPDARDATVQRVDIVFLAYRP